MTVRIDAVGNVRGSYPGFVAGRKRLVIGSHIDTVPDAGAFDGVLGVAIGIGLVSLLGRVAFPIELIAFSEEEGVRYGVPFIGSRAVVGTVDAELKALIAPAIREFGLDPDDLPGAELDDDVAAYLEFHIEQGPVLESLGEPLGVVEAIAGQTRMEFRFAGSANHAGTTPMHSRRDALAGAAEWIGCVEREARGTAGLVATVGRIDAEPGAGNVIAGRVVCSLDVRHAEDGVRVGAVERMERAASEIALRRGLAVTWRVLLERGAVRMDAGLTSGLAAPRLVSGAGHDAMILAGRIPAAMVFVRSPGGVSHHPDETVRVEDVEAALAAGLLLCRLME